MSDQDTADPRADDYRQDLFTEYDQRVAALDGDRISKVAWFRDYLRDNYMPGLGRVDAANAIVLDIGCSRGYLVEAFIELGWSNVTGIDLSPVDVARAIEDVPNATFECVSAVEFLRRRTGSFDVIVMKAVLEHTLKKDVRPLLAAVAASLRPKGTAIIDVPNMDWLFAGHERYMDFTHEVGFTRESLLQVMSGLFSGIEIRSVDHLTPHDRRSVRTRIGRTVLRRLLHWADPQGAGNSIWHRNLIAFGRREVL